jgi:4-hydroxy-2-oxoglutarate aldolase
MNRTLRGIIAPMTTPFKNGSLDIAGVRANVGKYAATALCALFVTGSNGENKSLTDKEKAEVLSAVMDVRSPNQLVIAGTGHESTQQTIALSRQAERSGADFVAVLTPSYFRRNLTEAALVGYFRDVADAISIPLLIYNAPGFTGTTISPAVVENLSLHPNIIGIKDSSQGDTSAYLEVVDREFLVFSGSIAQLYPALVLGAAGGVVSLADALPDLCCDLYEKAVHGRAEEACSEHFRLRRLGHAISGRFGVAGVKYAMDRAGYVGGIPRLPLLPLTDDERHQIDLAFERAGVRL